MITVQLKDIYYVRIRKMSDRFCDIPLLSIYLSIYLSIIIITN